LSFVECSYCGKYHVESDFFDSYETMVPKDRRFLLSFLTRQASEKGEPLLLTAEDLHAWRVMRKPSPLETIDLILRHVEDRLGSAEDAVLFRPLDYPLFCCKNENELSWLLAKALEVGFLEHHADSRYRLSLEGWQRVAQLPKTLLKTGQAFAAMHFSTEMMRVYEEAIKPALEECRWKPYNVGLVATDDKICDLILAEIRRSGLLVADFTDHRNSVYFEAGFARGLGIPVISTCKEGQLGQLAFDTRQYRHLEWRDAADLKLKLTNHLRASHPGPA
jgi:nucleoside 2-deoxyribosyltransferase